MMARPRRHPAARNRPLFGKETRPVPHSDTVQIDVARVPLIDTAGGQPMTLGEISGVQILVLLRHRH